MGDKNTKPSGEYNRKVAEAFKADTRFDEEMIKVFAAACWRHDWPLEKSAFESATFDSGEETAEKVNTFFQRVEAMKQSQHKHEEDDEDDDEDEKGKKKGPHYVSKSQEPIMFKEVAVKLGLAPTASKAAVIAKITALQEGQFSEGERESLEELRQRATVADFMEAVIPLTVVAGTPTEKAEKLADTLETQGEDAATERLVEWVAFQHSSEQAGVTKSLLSTYSQGDADDKPGPAEAKIREWMAAQVPVVTDFSAGLAHFATTELATFSAYHKEQSVTIA